MSVAYITALLLFLYRHQLSERDTEIQTLNIRLQNLPNNDAQITKSVSELQKLQHEFESLSLELKKGMFFL